MGIFGGGGGTVLLTTHFKLVFILFVSFTDETFCECHVLLSKFRIFC